MGRFRKKPIEVEAVQFFTAGDHPSVSLALKDRKTGAIVGTSAPFKVPTIVVHAIETKEGWHEVSPGDWIITGIAGEYYPCKPHIFDQTYEPVA